MIRFFRRQIWMLLPLLSLFGCASSVSYYPAVPGETWALDSTLFDRGFRVETAEDIYFVERGYGRISGTQHGKEMQAWGRSKNDGRPRSLILPLGDIRKFWSSSDVTLEMKNGEDYTLYEGAWYMEMSGGKVMAVHVKPGLLTNRDGDASANRVRIDIAHIQGMEIHLTGGEIFWNILVFLVGLIVSYFAAILLLLLVT